MAWYAMRTVEYIILLNCVLRSGIALYRVAWCIMAARNIVQHGVVALHFSWPISWRQITVDRSMRAEAKE
eukprot:6662019-Pyramimonas_sp.AAC.1